MRIFIGERREAIRKFWSDLIVGANATAAELTTVELMESGEGVVEIGNARLTIEPAGQAAVYMEAKYVVFWQQEAGQWKWQVDIWNANA